jgi:hypothetical protein
MRIEVSIPSVYGFSPRSMPSDDETASTCSAGLPYGVSDASSESSDSRIRPLGAPKATRGEVQPLKYKTQLCGYYVRGEQCPFDPWCAFAHGDEELRTVEGNVMDGVAVVNTLPRTIVFHEEWVQKTKYTRKTGPAEPSAKPATAAPPRPSFMKVSAPVATAAPAPAKAQAPLKVRQHNPYGACVIAASH